MRHKIPFRYAALLAMGTLAGGTGCIHNHYYGYVPSQVPVSGCEVAPAVIGATSAPRLGSVCEVPTQSPPASPSGPTPMVTRAPSPPRIVSQPVGGSSGGGRFRSFAWRRQDPESVAQTHVEGAYDDETTLR